MNPIRRLSVYAAAVLLAGVISGRVCAESGKMQKPDITIALERQPDRTEDSILLPQVLDLKTAQKIALERSPSLWAAAQVVEQARQKMKQARSAWFPQVSTTVAASRTRLDKNSYEQQQQVTSLLQTQAQENSQQQQFVQDLSQLPGLSSTAQTIQIFSEVLTPSENVDRTFTDYTVSLKAQWSLFDGLSRHFTWLATRYARKESEAGYLEGMRLLMDAVARAYYSAILARENKRVTAADEAFQRRLHKEAQARYRAGQSSLSDELNFEVRANLSHTQVIESALSYDTAMIALARLMGMPEGQFPEEITLAPLDEEKPEDLEAPDAEGLVEYTIAHRPDLLKKDHEVSRKDASAKSWRGEMLPSMGITASETSSSRGSFDVSSDDFSSTITAGMTWDIFTGGRYRARWKEAKASRRQSECELAQAEIDALSEVHTALKSLTAAQEQIRLQRSNVVLVRENRDMVEKAYNVGQISLVRLNEAQRDLLQAEVQFTLAQVGLCKAWHDLRTATGETLELVAEENIPEP